MPVKRWPARFDSLSCPRKTLPCAEVHVKVPERSLVRATWLRLSKPSPQLWGSTVHACLGFFVVFGLDDLAGSRA